MNPRRPDLDVVERRLRALADTLTDLERLRDVDVERLRSDPIIRAATERLLQVTVDLAVDVNAHLSATLLDRAPGTGRDSFLSAAEAGVLPAALADQLAPAAGLRNVLVHRYVDIDPELVAQGLRDVLDLMPEYVEAVADFLGQLPR